ncbi:MAG: flagellar motor protein MotB [Pyrinomonadaceae bacterium]
MEDKKPQEEEPPRRPRKKKAKGHGGHHGGAWKVAYADFVTAMMALFLVLWLVSQADTKLKEQIANYFKSPGAFTSSRGGILPGKTSVSKEPQKLSAEEETQTLYGIAQQLQRKFDSQPEFTNIKEKIAIEVTDEGLQIEIIDKADDISFEVGSSVLNESAMLILKEIAQAICQMPNGIKIGGHTDRRIFPSDNGYSNWELSSDRANAARRILVKNCVEPKQIRRIVGFADTDPIIPNDPYHPANRRISITVLREIPVEDSGATAPITDEPVMSTSDDLPKRDEKIEKMREKIRAAADDEKKPSDSETEKTKEPESRIEEGEKKPKPETTEKDKTDAAKAKLKKEGSVTVGEPDKVPKAPVTKETKPKQNN